jgi:hypothetical protein
LLVPALAEELQALLVLVPMALAPMALMEEYLPALNEAD